MYIYIFSAHMAQTRENQDSLKKNSIPVLQKRTAEALFIQISANLQWDLLLNHKYPFPEHLSCILRQRITSILHNEFISCGSSPNSIV